MQRQYGDHGKCTYLVNELATAYIMKQIGPKRFADFLASINITDQSGAISFYLPGRCDLSMYEMLYGYSILPAVVLVQNHLYYD